MNETNMVVGDWSNDGHGRTTTITIRHNLTQEGLRQAYREGSLSLEYCPYGSPAEDIMDYIASEYSDNSIPADLAVKLVDAGIPYGVWVDGQWVLDPPKMYFACEDGTWSVEGSDEFVELWLQIAKLGNPDLEYKIINPDTIHVGGYGLFY